jgi:hypothetical protein
MLLLIIISLAAADSESDLEIYSEEDLDNTLNRVK